MVPSVELALMGDIRNRNAASDFRPPGPAVGLVREEGRSLPSYRLEVENKNGKRARKNMVSI